MKKDADLWVHCRFQPEIDDELLQRTLQAHPAFQGKPGLVAHTFHEVAVCR